MCDCCEKKNKLVEYQCDCIRCQKPVCKKMDECVEYVVDFSKPCSSLFKHNTKLIYRVDDKFLLMIYGFANTECSSCETRICIKTDSKNACDNGVGLTCKDSHGCSKHFIQIDMGDYIRIKNLKCGNPKMKVGGFRENFCVYGSNKLGVLGQQLYTNKDKKCHNEGFVIPSFNTNDNSECGDLWHYGVLPFRYISISACGTNIVLNSLYFYLC